MPTDTRTGKRNRNYNYNSVYGRDRVYRDYGASTAYDVPQTVHSRRNEAYYGAPGVKRTPVRTLPARRVSTGETSTVTVSKSASSVNNGANVKRDKKAMRRVAFVSLCVFVAAVIILCRYVSISNSNRRINELEKEYAKLVSSNQAMQVKIDGRLEKGEIEKIAKEELGMMEPEAYQMFYIDMEMPDSGSGQKGSSDENVLGTAGTLLNAFRTLK